MCNGESCEQPGLIEPPSSTEEYKTITSSRDTHRFHVSFDSFSDSQAEGKCHK